MNLSDRGLELIQSFEGYHTAQPDGSCVAYLCPAGVPTIGWGCTEGVRLGMRWTRKQADEAYLRELSKFEAGINRLVTVEMNQNEFDAMVSLAYNIGLGGKDRRGKTVPGFSTSTVLTKLNRGDRTGAAAGFPLWNKGGGRVLNGLVRRRKAEADLFLEPATPVEPEIMAQKVDPSREPVSNTTKAVAAAAGGGAVAKGGEALITAPPAAVTDTVANVDMWSKVGKAATTMADGLWKSPVFAASLFAVAIAVIWGPTLWKRMTS
jgi:lysozyme